MRAHKSRLSTPKRAHPRGRAVTFDHRHHVLLVQQASGRWAFPGGHVEPNETPAEAAVRETWEETSVPVTLLQHLYNDGIQFYFLAAAHPATIHIRDTDEITHAAFMPVAAALNLLKEPARDVLILAARITGSLQ